MLLGETFRATGPPPAGLIPISGGSIKVPEPTKPATPPVKAPNKAPALESEALPPTSTNTKKNSAPPQPSGGTSAFNAQVIASQLKEKNTSPQEEVSLRHPPPAEPLAQRTKQQLSGEELKIVQQLSALDRQVRSHEQAHVSAASGLAGAPSFSYVTGPDAQRYAVSGEVKIETSVEHGDPEATIAKMEQVIKAALAPAQPSGQDKAVASAAEAIIRAAQAEIKNNEQNQEELEFNEATLADIHQATRAFTNITATTEPASLFAQAIFA